MLPAIQYLGFQNFLLAVVLGGVIQFFTRLFPSRYDRLLLSNRSDQRNARCNWINHHLKTDPYAFGYDKDYEGDLAFGPIGWLQHVYRIEPCD